MCLPFAGLAAGAPSDSQTQTILQLLQDAQREAKAHGATYTPVLSPMDNLLSGNPPVIDLHEIQKAGFPVVVWTVDDPTRMAQLISDRVDGIISDRPDLLREELNKAHQQANSRDDRAYFARFDAEGHRGGRDLRPENTLPAFEAGLDQLITTIETDTGVTSDRVSLISHEPFINPQTCRRADGNDYSPANQILIKDISMAEAQSRFICDKVFRGPAQKNDLALSPVAVAFAKAHNLISPYVPTNAGQLYQFVEFYVAYYKSAAGRSQQEAEARWRNAEKVRFNLETKIDPRPQFSGRTFGPEIFTETLARAIEAHRMESRSDIQSFDFRTLHLTARNHPKIQTVFLIESVPSPAATGSSRRK